MSKDAPLKVGLLLVGHGTRDQQGLAEFHELAGLLRAKAASHEAIPSNASSLQAESVPVEACFLELAEPTIEAGVRQLLNLGVSQLVVAPLLLFAAGHAKRDIPLAISKAIEKYAYANEATQLPPLECHEKLLSLSAVRFQAAQRLCQTLTTNREASDSTNERSEIGGNLGGKTTLVLVGRGSMDSAASEEMNRFARLRAAQLPGVELEVGFYAMAEPKLAEVLQRVANSAAEQVILQPHLLFSGEVLAGIRSQAASMAESVTHRQQWWLTEPLGAHPLLAEALWDLFQAGRRV